MPGIEELILPPSCDCLEAHNQRGRELVLHGERQDTALPAWQRLLDYIAETAAKRREFFAPAEALSREEMVQIVELPREVASLKRVAVISLYGSSLLRIPPEVGEMEVLFTFDPYTSYRLHWFPFEIIHCRHLRRTRVSTRALYGNKNTRIPFPDLRDPANSPGLDAARPARCSVCKGSFGSEPPQARWISLHVGLDVLPLLAFPCSRACMEKLPMPEPGYFTRPHQGGRSLELPPGRGR